MYDYFRKKKNENYTDNECYKSNRNLSVNYTNCFASQCVMYHAEKSMWQWLFPQNGSMHDEWHGILWLASLCVFGQFAVMI